MFSLIITIISIALVAALALATLYYGGSAFNKGSAGAEAARLINEGQQVNGAVAILNADKGLDSGNATLAAITDGAGLVSGGYLAQVPASFTVSDLTVPVTKTVSAEVCEEVNKRAGRSDATAAITGVFGCLTAGAAGSETHTFSYSLQ